MIESIWSRTYRKDYLPGLDMVSITTAVHEGTPGGRRLVADLEADIRVGAGVARVDVAMTPTQMRALAAMLTDAARRVEDVLIPLLEREPDLIPFTLEPAMA